MYKVANKVAIGWHGMDLWQAAYASTEVLGNIYMKVMKQIYYYLGSTRWQTINHKCWNNMNPCKHLELKILYIYNVIPVVLPSGCPN